MSKTRIALFGGSFDPPHLGHQLVVSYLLGSQNFDQVVLCPTAKHALGKPLIHYTHRHIMTARMLQIFNQFLVQVSAAEDFLVKNGQPDSRTIHLVRNFVDSNPEAEFHLVIGSDLLEQAKTWDDWEEITKLSKIFVVGRLGYGNEKLVLPNISSTEIRKDIDSMSHHLPHNVYEYVKEHKLYGSKGPL